MKRFTRHTIAAFALLLFALPAAAQSQDPGFERSTLVIVSGDERHPFTVEMAVTSEQRAQGLMFRRELAADAGMLFDFGKRPSRAAMWMKNTLIPLDMLFIAPDGRIESIAERTVPHSLESISSRGPVRAVLELNGGTVSRLGIEPGDRVEHPLFGTGG